MSATVVAPPIPEKSKLRQKSFSGASHPEDEDGNDEVPKKSRFVEQFDVIPPPELLDALQETDFHVPTTRKRTKSNAVSKPFLPFLTSSQSSSTLSTTYKIHGSNTTEQQQQQQQQQPATGPRSAGEMNNNNHSPNSPSVATKQSTSFWSPPAMKRSTSVRSRGKDDSPHRSNSTSTNKGPARINTLFSLNRAEVIINRLEDWQALLKAVIGWLEEVAKIHFHCSRGYSQRTLPLVKREGDHDEKDAKATIQAGLQLLTLNVAEQHKEFGKRVQLDLLPSLQKLRKDCKEMIRGLKEEPDLLMDELLRLAETTRKAMATLNKHCKAAAAAAAAAPSNKSIEHDPMMSNLFVLRHLKREVDEENRMRELMVPIQKGTIAFEKRVIDQLKTALAYCYGFLAPKLWVGASATRHLGSSSSASDTGGEEEEEEEEEAPYKLVLKQLIPEYEWNRFYESKKKELVDEANPRKEYLKISYPNKMSPYVMTVAKGVLERRIGVLKQFAERYYILSQCGFLHEFALNDKVSPERSIYIPDCEIFADPITESTNSSSRYTFTIHKKGSQVLQRDRVYTFRANNREELKSWYDMLLRASTGSIAVPPPQQVIIPNHQQQQQHSPKHNQESELDPNANAEQGVEPELHPEQEPNKGQELGPKQQPSADSSRSQHSNGSNVSVGRTAAAAASSSTPSHPSHRSLAGLDDENDNGCGSARSSIMTAKPLAHDTEDDGPTVSADVNNSISAVCSVKDESISRTEDDDGEHKEDIVDDVVREYAFDDAPRLETPRTSALFDDSESSIYFSSTSAPPSPSSVISDDHSINGIAIPTLEAEDEEEEDTPATPRAYTPPRSDIYIPMLNHPHS